MHYLDMKAELGVVRSGRYRLAGSVSLVEIFAIFALEAFIVRLLDCCEASRTVR